MTFEKIIVTGASGFLGGRTLKAFKALYPQSEVVGTGRRAQRKEEFENIQCRFEQGDLLDADFCRGLCEKADLVIHCAALSSPWGSYETFYKSNVEATEILLQAALEKGVSKFVFISTPSVYFTHEDRFDIREDEPLPKPLINAYAQTKLLAENVVLAQNGVEMKTIALRPRAIIGAEDTVIMPRVLKAYHEGKLRMIGNGKNIVDLTCVLNVIEAIHCAATANEEAYGDFYNITDGSSVSLWGEINNMLQQLGKEKISKKLPLSVARLVAQLSEGWSKYVSKKEPTLTDYGIGILARNFTLDISKARTTLNYHPKYSTREGITEFVHWYKNKSKDEGRF